MSLCLFLFYNQTISPKKSNLVLTKKQNVQKMASCWIYFKHRNLVIIIKKTCKNGHGNCTLLIDALYMNAFRFLTMSILLTATTN